MAEVSPPVLLLGRRKTGQHCRRSLGETLPTRVPKNARGCAHEKEVQTHYRAQALGRTDQITESFYAISVERKLHHPAVVAITDAARETSFA